MGCAILHSVTNSGLIAGRDKIQARKDRLYSLIKITGISKSLIDQTTSCILQAEEVEKTPGYGVLGRKTACNEKDCRCNAIILDDTLPAYCISKVVVMKSEEIMNQKYMCHLDHFLQR